MPNTFAEMESERGMQSSFVWRIAAIANFFPSRLFLLLIHSLTHSSMADHIPTRKQNNIIKKEQASKQSRKMYATSFEKF